MPRWPQAGSDLAADPAITFGVLGNGMRYAIQHNATPPGQVSLRLMILAGSMQEAADQEGLAHFLEHMAFRGSTNVPAGETMPMLERLGMRLGADINAATTRDFTIYKFDLAKNDAHSVDIGLTLLREIGSELTLDPALMDAERKVVLAEAHSYSAPQLALSDAVSKAVFGGHPYARSPIGRTEVIAGAPVQRLRDYYEAYYRPERAVLIVAGDIDPAAIEAKIKAKYASWRGTGTAGRDPAPMKAANHSAEVRLAVVPGIGSSGQGVGLFYLHPPRPFQDSRAEARDRLIYSIAARAMQLRLNDLSDRAGKPFGASSAFIALPVSARVGRVDFANLALLSDWKTSLEVLVKAQRQILQYGFSQNEITLAVSLRRADIVGAMVQAASMPSPVIANGLAGDLENGFVSDSADQTLALFDEMVKTLTPEEVLDVLRVHTSGAGPLIFMAAPDPLPGGEAALKDAYEKAVAAPVEAFVPPAAKAWSYASFGTPGTVVERRTYDPAGVTMIRFANGLRLTVKQTNSNPQQVMFKLRFGRGQLDLPRDHLAASDLATSVINMGGLKDLTQQEAVRALAGNGILNGAGMEDDAFSFNQLPVRSDLFKREMQILAAQVSAPGWRTDDWPSLIASIARSEDADRASPLAVYNHQSPAMLHKDDWRWVMDTPQMRAAWKPEDAVAFIKPILTNAPLELIVVGDITPDDAIAAVAPALGALPARPDVAEPKGLRTVRFPSPTATPIELHHSGPAFQALAVINWPTTDALANPRESEAAMLLAAIMQERAFVQIRNTEGKAYSPSVSAAFSEVLPGYGMLSAKALVEPGDLAGVFADFDAIAADLAVNDVSADEFARVQGARLEDARRNARRIGFWMHNLAGAQSDPRLMQAAAHEVDDIAGLIIADIRAVAKKWLIKQKSWRMQVTPQKP